MLPSANAAAAWSKTVSLALIVWGLLQAWGSMAVKSIAVTPRLVEVVLTVLAALTPGASEPLPGTVLPSVALPVFTAAVSV